MKANPTSVLQCRTCGNPQLKKLSMIYLEGTSRSQNVALGFYRGFRRSLLLTSRGSRQSLLAQKAAPPRKKSYTLAVALWTVVTIMLLLILLLMGVDLNVDVFATVMLVSIFAAGLHLSACHRFNKTQWPMLYATWNRSFLCRRCGTVSIF